MPRHYPPGWVLTMQWLHGVVLGALALLGIFKMLVAYSFHSAAQKCLGQPTENGVNMLAANSAFLAAICEWLQVLAVMLLFFVCMYVFGIVHI